MKGECVTTTPNTLVMTEHAVLGMTEQKKMRIFGSQRRTEANNIGLETSQNNSFLAVRCYATVQRAAAV
jgi:hypothetical protein